jgi:RNA polymerase sigma-70 factor (ECF subfamily)
MSDSALIAACKSGDQWAFECLLKRYERTVNAWIFQLVPDWQDRSDLVQEVFIKVWRTIASLHRAEAFRVWLRRLTTHIVYDHLRRLPKSPALSIESAETEGGDHPFTREIADFSRVPDVVYERNELDAAIRKALARLPDEFRIAVVLREMGGLTYEEIVERTGTGIGTVKSRISRARNKVKRLLSSYLKGSSCWQ